MIPAPPMAAAVSASALLVAATSTWAQARPSPRPAAPERAVGVTLNTGPGGERQAFALFLGAGADAIEAPQPWSALEPGRDRFHLGDVAAIVQGVSSIPAMRILVIPAAIETTRRSVPADLAHTPWDSPRMIGRYQVLMRRLTAHLSRQVRYVSIANEADVYLNAHPGQLRGFVHFARVEIAELHRLAPWVKTGVTVTSAGLTSPQPDVARTLANLGDATIVTYYPLARGYQLRSPRAPRQDIPQMVRLARGRPLVIQEAGYSSAPRLGGSPSAQAAFVRNVFTSWSRFPRAIPFVSFYSLFDQPGDACRGRSDASTFLCTLGLRRRDGRPKPAWAAFRAGAGAIRSRRSIIERQACVIGSMTSCIWSTSPSSSTTTTPRSRSSSTRSGSSWSRTPPH